jgi:hypothetical protein
LAQKGGYPVSCPDLRPRLFQRLADHGEKLITDIEDIIEAEVIGAAARLVGS